MMLNLLYAAVLALVGWYLMGPPTLTALYGLWHTKKQESDAELTQRGLFETAEEARAYAIMMSYARCVATEDPRLKEK